MATPAAPTMNSAFRMFMPAIVRETCFGSQRVWISANSGTMKKPPNTPISTRSATMRRLPGSASSANASTVAVFVYARLAKYRSMPNTDSPIEPNGTSPISTLRPESFSQSSEPMPIPSENTVSSSTNTLWSPCR
jgi:hypothetical protein